MNFAMWKKALNIIPSVTKGGVGQFRSHLEVVDINPRGSTDNDIPVCRIGRIVCPAR